MDNNIQILIMIAGILLFIIIGIILYLIIRKLIYRKDNNITKYKDILIRAVLGCKLESKDKISIYYYFKTKQTLKLNKIESDRINKLINLAKAEKKYIRKLNSVYKIKRIQAASYLGVIGTDKVRISLENKLVKERNTTVRLYIAIALGVIADSRSISALIASLKNSNRFYRDRVNMLIIGFGESFNLFLPKIINTDKIETKELIVDFAMVYFSEEIKDFLIKIIDKKDYEISKIRRIYEIKSSRKVFISSKKEEEKYKFLVYKACDILAKYYPSRLTQHEYLYSEDIIIRNKAITALGNVNIINNFEKLLAFLKTNDTQKSAISTISRILENNSEYINKIVELFYSEEDIELKIQYSKILSKKIEYFIIDSFDNTNIASEEIIKQILLLGTTEELINFINKNKDESIEKKLINIIKEVMAQTNIITNEIYSYLNSDLAIKYGIQQLKSVKNNKNYKKDKRLILNLYIILFLSLLFFPIIYFVNNSKALFENDISLHIIKYIIEFNYFIAYYSIALNIIYIVLMFFSYIGAKRQLMLWKIKSDSLLFQKKMLPSVSIIAPAYNEESTIVESVNSLLNVKYPDYELIIINDGSNDKTLDILINKFELIKVNKRYDSKLRTKSIRAIYINPSIQKLIVVDKYNGGKADSLNAGINISKKEYICGIDADSILEEEALLKLASVYLDSGMETPALGGNIFPVNGCRVEKGHIACKHIPNKTISRFQTIEYVRAFMAGRLGWAQINSLLLISGAFGLFRKERVICIGGYLTSSEKYEKDTVGEDMELVVRISSYMKEKMLKYKINCCFLANCWTEVPESIMSLKKQRYRWHKGLLEIMNFHKKMLFNIKYQRIGLVAMPYFLIFEVIGPLIEFQGLIFVIIATIFGLMNFEIALILFISTVLLGVIVSIFSLIIAELNRESFTIKEVIILVGYAIIENFGPRQLFSLWRVGAFFDMLVNPVEWNKSERKGFNTENS